MAGDIMEIISALQTAKLSATIINKNLQKYVDLINANINPPIQVKASEVVIRAMYIISDGVNSFGGKFHRADLPQIARLFIDSPVLVGHDKSCLPVARNFWAETVERGEKLWVKSYFYWLKQADGASRLKVNIDSGIYKECSVSFTYSYPECSACGGDIRNCGHQVSPDVFFYYRGVEKILETSLVYRGAMPDTSITDQLSRANIESASSKQKDSHRMRVSSDKNKKPNSTGIFNVTPSAYLYGHPGVAGRLEGFVARINSSDFILARSRE